MKYVIDVENLTLNYDKTPVLWDLSLKIEPGKLVAIVGPNGAGKSSFLKAAIGELKPVSGRILFKGESFHTVRDQISYIPQKETIDWDFPITVFEVVLMGRYQTMGFFKRAKKSDIHAAEEALEKVDMCALKNRQISELSGGQKQKLFLARALAQKAEIYLMDEPFQCVDASTERAMVDLLKGLKNQGKSILIVHHDLSTIRNIFDEVILINTSLIDHGSVNAVLTKENLERAYSKNHHLFDELGALSSKKVKGLVS